MDNANQDNKKGKNFFALDEGETITSSLKENDSFKFLSKIAKDEGLFSDFINNMNYRGTYQLLESIRIIVRDYEANIFSLIKMKRMLTGVSKIAGASDTLVRQHLTPDGDRAHREHGVRDPELRPVLGLHLRQTEQRAVGPLRRVVQSLPHIGPKRHCWVCRAQR